MRHYSALDAPASQRRRLTPAQVIVFGFLAVILSGAVLLSLPLAANRGVHVSFPTALFTSCSATCITGLTVVDTALTWSVFGRAVILCLIQIGGLGFMSVTTVFFFALNKRIDLSRRILLVQSMNLKDIEGVVRLLRHVLAGTVIAEAAGAIVLWVRFAPEYGALKGLELGIFHSVSAFCNAGIDLFGGDLSRFADDAVVLLTLTFLVLFGGLGFFVWEDIWRNRGFRGLHLHSKLVLAVSGCLLGFGFVFFLLAERNAAFAGMPLPKAALASLFQTVMPRSGGFTVIDQGAFTGAGRLVTTVLMLIGGSAGSAAGGIKNVTAGILFLSAVRFLRGKSNVSVFKRTIPQRQIFTALSIMIMVLTAWLAGAAAIALIQPDIPFGSVLFEAASAIATCGLSHGVTEALAPASRAVVMLLMFFGRVGIITVGMAAFINRGGTEKTKHPDTWVMMG
ncbi:MAG: potassium uptake protein, TrkH family [Oscillospiraceae bacterium]|jgi:trk system potassium uptake protein TrkH|nr:potassium uptake protein, TrkH family [Oscillospiraceae bacterium]